MTSSPTLRLATTDDAPAICALMRASVRSEFPQLHDARQTESAARYISRLDPVLIDDGTYFVYEADGALVACGGWSKRGKLFEVERRDIVMPDGVATAGVIMTRPIQLRAG